MVTILREQGVGSSNLPAPTNKSNNLMDQPKRPAQDSAQGRQGADGSSPPGDGEPRKKFSRLPEGTAGRGYPVKLSVSKKEQERRKARGDPTQDGLMNLWRRRSMQLYNLLVDLEQAAYSGENLHADLGWRQAWADVAQENYERDLNAFQKGGRFTKSGAPRKRRGTEPPKEPKPLQEDYLARIRGHGFDPALGPDGKPIREKTAPRNTKKKQQNGSAAPEDAKPRAPEPALFLWKRDLMAVMARLKAKPQTAWIADLPSHAAQKVCEDVEGAIKSMLRERKKAAAGLAARDWGFPKRKKTGRYAAGSIYFANTQLKIDGGRGRIWLPNGVGWIALANNANQVNEQRRRQQAAREKAVGAGPQSGPRPAPMRAESYDLPPEGARLMGARLWRKGEDWMLSIQAAVEPPKALPATGRACGVAIAAKVMLTVYDDQGRSMQMETPAPDPRRARRYRLAALRQSRALQARKARIDKRAARRARRDQIKTEQAATDPAFRPRGMAHGRPHVPMSRTFYRTANRMAQIEAQNTCARDIAMHKAIAGTVKRYDTITCQRMDVAAMLKSSREQRHERREKAAREAGGAVPRPTPPKRVLKHLRKLNRRAAMGRVYATLKRKAEELGRTFNETHQLFPDAQLCSGCGHVNRKMADGRRHLKCDSCGLRMERRKNRARNELQQGEIVREASGMPKLRPPEAAG